MKRSHLLAVVVAAALLGAAAFSQKALQYVLVSCTGDQCEYKIAASFMIQGKPSVRFAAPSLESVSAAALNGFPETKLEQVPGLYRDPTSGILYGLAADWSRSDIAVPLRLVGKDAVPPGEVWKGAPLDYVLPGAKVKATGTLDNFAYLLVSADPEQAVFQLFQRLLNVDEKDPRRLALLRGALQFNGKSPSLQKSLDALLAQIRDQMTRFDGQTGDPVTLGKALHEAVQLRTVYLQAGDAKANKELLDHVVAADEVYSRRFAIAEALRAASLWDEYLAKIRQIGLAQWSAPDALAHEQEALTQSSKQHLARSLAFAKDGHFDRAFDEAGLAARQSCDRDVIDTFYRSRVTLVTSNEIPKSLEYSGPQKALLDQTMRGLEPLDPAKEAVTLENIKEGEQFDPTFLPLQMKKVEFLDLLGRYTEALAALQRIERTVRLDHQQLEACLKLDAGIRTNLRDAVQKSLDDTKKAFDDGRYLDALTATAKGLKADPAHAGLLYYGAMSAAFLRQAAAAAGFIRTFLNDANMTCTQSGDPERLLELSRLIAAPPARPDASDGSIPNWISGVRYRLQEAFYDPVSLGFLQPITRIISTRDGVTTMFRRQDRSLLVDQIVTAKVTLNAGLGSTGVATVLFDAEPKYDRQTLSMLEIGQTSTASVRTNYRLTYLNSPLLDPGLVLKFTGRQVARGWAGNPFFHPFVWNGFYIFDLTYDQLGRVIAATPVNLDAGSRVDPFSEPLVFNWHKDTKILVSIQGKRSGYTRELNYDQAGLLVSETITMPKVGKGVIQYDYLPNSAQLRGARVTDSFWDNRDRVVSFDWSPAK